MIRTYACALVLLGWETAMAQGLFEQAVSGQKSDEDPGEDVSSETIPGRSIELGGYVRGDLFIGKAPGVDASQVKSGYGELALTARPRVGQWGDAFGELRLRAGSDWGERVTDIKLREAYVNVYLGPVDLRFGHQIIVWGRADGFNPTDKLTPWDMNVRSANEDDRRLPNLAVRGYLNYHPLRVEAVWVPLFGESRFPRFALPPPLTLAEPDHPDQNLTKGIAALRLHLETAAFEGSISYLVGHSTFPGLTLVRFEPALPPAASVVEVGVTTYRHQQAGGDFSFAIGEFAGVRGEFAYRRPFDYQERVDVPLPDLYYVLGADREIVRDVTLIVQYIGRYVFDWEELPPSKLPEDGGPFPISEALSFPDGPAAFATNEVRHKVRAIYNQQERVSHAASLRISFTMLHETLTFEVLGYYSFTLEDYLVRPKLDYALADGLNVTLGGEVYGGPADTLFGMVDETLSAGFVELSLAF